MKSKFKSVTHSETRKRRGKNGCKRVCMSKWKQIQRGAEKLYELQHKVKQVKHEVEEIKLEVKQITKAQPSQINIFIL